MKPNKCEKYSFSKGRKSKCEKKFSISSRFINLQHTLEAGQRLVVHTSNADEDKHLNHSSIA